MRFPNWPGVLSAGCKLAVGANSQVQACNMPVALCYEIWGAPLVDLCRLVCVVFKDCLRVDVVVLCLRLAAGSSWLSTVEYCFGALQPLLCKQAPTEE